MMLTLHTAVCNHDSIIILLSNEVQLEEVGLVVNVNSIADYELFTI